MSTELPATPYINAADLKPYTARTVRLVAKIISVLQNNAVVQVQAADNGTVLVHRAAGTAFEHSPYSSNKYVCVTGVVQGDGSIRESTVEGWGEEFDLATFNAVVNAKEKYSSIFI